MRVHGDIPIIGVLTDNYIGSGVPGHGHTFFEGGGEARGFDGNISAASAGHLPDGGDSFFRSCIIDIDNRIYAELPREFQPVGRSADNDDVDRSDQLCEDGGVQSDGAAALDDYCVAKLDAGLFNGVICCRQSATRADKSLRFDSRG